jgi:elongation factor Ts
MAGFTAKDVQRLRQDTGAGMMDAKRALEECAGDFDAARTWLREKGKAQAAKRSDRESSQGAIAVANTGTAAAAVELRCETDFVAKSAEFRSLVSELAEAVAAKGEASADERAGDITDLGVTLKEHITLGRVARFEAAAGAVLDTYLHVQSDRGVIGVLVELTGGDQALTHEVALHIASANPRYLRRDDVPPEVVAEERAVLENLTRNEGKPEQAVPKIVEGRMNGFFKETCLLEQPYVKDQKQTIRQLLGGADVTRFARLEIGK